MSKHDDYARAVIAEGQRRNITPRGIKIALATVLVETNMRMYANKADPQSMKFPHDAVGSDANSVGLFQQRAPWWGTVECRMDPACSAGLFYDELAKLDYNNEGRSPGSFAQDVQKSAFPGRYDERFAEAEDIYNRLVDDTGTDPAPDAEPVEPPVVTVARKQLGKMYEWGATGPDTFDCSGLLQYCFKQVGVDIPRVSQKQAEGGEPVDRGELQPGDVVIIYPQATHCGLYSGDGNIIHASTTGQPVKEVPLDQAGPYRNARRYPTGATLEPEGPRPDFNEYPIWTANNHNRGGTTIDLFALHTQEGDGNADGLARYLKSTEGGGNPVSYHYTVSVDLDDDGVTVVDCVDTDRAAWSVGNSNNRSINLCFAGSKVSWSRDDWLRRRRAIDVAAYLAVQDCRKYDIDPQVIPPPYDSDPPGIADHRYCGQRLKDGNNHTDVGDNFPWDYFAERVDYWLNPDEEGEPVPEEKPDEPKPEPEKPDDKPDDKPSKPSKPAPKPPRPGDLQREIWDQLRIEWPQLGGKTLVDATGDIRDMVRAIKRDGIGVELPEGWQDALRGAEGGDKPTAPSKPIRPDNPDDEPSSTKPDKGGGNDKDGPDYDERPKRSWDGWRPGMSGPTITAVKDKLRAKFSYAADLDDTDMYDTALEDVVKKFQQRVHEEVDDGDRNPPDVRTDGVVDWATLVQLGVIDKSDPDKPPPDATKGPRHLGVVFRGTGGIIGEDLVSQVCQATADLVEEVNPEWPATMGGIPVGASGGPDDPSMSEGVKIAYSDAKRIIRDALSENPNRKIVVGGYSAGAVVAARVRKWLVDNHEDNYLCSFSFGDPSRPRGGAYYDGTPPDGRGIGSWRYGDTEDWRHCWLTDPDDIYGNVPRGDTGAIMSDAYDMVTNFELSDPLASGQEILRSIPSIMEHAGLGIPSLFKALTGGLPSILGFGAEALMGGLHGLIRGAMGSSGKLEGPAAAAQAAIVALKFVTTNPPTAPHIEYHVREVWPGQTYLGLAIQHVVDYATKSQPVAA